MKIFLHYGSHIKIPIRQFTILILSLILDNGSHIKIAIREFTNLILDNDTHIKITCDFTRSSQF